MKNLKSYEIRQMWLDFFKERGHEVIESAPLVPINDPSLLWINAGIAPLKKYFDGREVPSNRRMVNAQKSIRTNDIDNVGKTARHHTFFEMLGNFSIGDYFRKEALAWGFEILTSPKYFDFPLEKLYFTVHPKDDETKKLWVKLGVDPSHLVELEGNFWEIGEGPCGPCTEIFFDRGIKYDPENVGVKLLQEEIDNDRYIEIWNIVFSQFNAVVGVDRSEYNELPSKNIDTGMGLERMACIMQEVDTNYETDLFMPIIKKTEELTKITYSGQMAFKVIADHLRSVVFAVADGAVLSNEGRGYVLRRILRRAVRYGKKLGMNEAFLYKLVEVVADNMNTYYPYLKSQVEGISKLIKTEEIKFLTTLETGEKRLTDYIKEQLDNKKEKIVTGEEAFLLYDTFGFPFELTLEVANEYDFDVDEAGFREALIRQKELSRASRQSEMSMNSQNEELMNFKEESQFVGYEKLSVSSKVIAIFSNEKFASTASGTVLAIFDVTPFYAESGGQIGDVGTLEINGQEYNIVSTTKLPNLQHASVVELTSDVLSVGDTVILKVDEAFRSKVIKNHSATHLLNESLRRVVGSHIYQQGSFVGEEFLRFDFNNYNNLSNEELLEVERLVNIEISNETPVDIREMQIKEAKEKGAQAVFGEKYSDVVRVVNMDFSIELCGGCHVENTGDIRKFVILSIESKGSGIYRIVATTDKNIKTEISKVLANINIEINDLLNVYNNLKEEAKSLNIEIDSKKIEFTNYFESYEYIIKRKSELNNLREIVKELDKLVTKVKKDKNVISLDEYLKNVLTINNYNVLISRTFNLEIDSLKDLADRLSDSLEKSIIFLANVREDDIVFICKNNIDKIHAGNLVKEAALLTDGRGGGRSDFAQAGGKSLDKLDTTLTRITSLVKENL